MEDKKINKKLVIVSVLIATIITSIGVAFGYFVWNSTTNTDISFTVEGAVVQLDDGTDIKGANLMPVASYTSGGKDVVKKGIKIKLKDTVSDTVTVDFKLKVNSIDSGLNHSSFKYNLVNASGTSVKSGNFSTSKAGDSISLLTLSTSDGSLTTSLSTYTLYIYIDGASGANPSSMMNQSFDFSLDVTGTNSSVEYTGLATAVVKKLDDGTTGDSGSGVYKVEHSAIPAESSATGSEIPAVTDYRYYGANPNNYICLDMEGQSTCPDRGLFRIIGSIYEENAGTNLIKVIKDGSLSDGNIQTFGWDYKPDGTYKNIWSGATSGTASGASVMQLLNGIYLSRSSGIYYNGSTEEVMVDFTNSGLTENAQKLMNTGMDDNGISRYYLGSYSDTTLKTEVVYLAERGKTTVSDSAKYWDGKVGLAYVSDYGYAAGKNCVDNNNVDDYYLGCKSRVWLCNFKNGNYKYIWTISSKLSTTDIVYLFSFHGAIARGQVNNYNVMTPSPVFYLNSSVSITGGTGTQDDPYLVS